MARFRSLACDDEVRRAQVRAHASIDGIDYIEVPPESLNTQRRLQVYFLKAAPPQGLAGHPELFRIEGGVRIRNIRVLSVTPDTDHLVVEVDQAGDFSMYTLIISSPILDPVYAECDFSFKAGCPTHFDCKPRQTCPPEPHPTPLIDYMAKDYASFRQALIDRIPTLVPGWKERHEADLGIALVELLAYAGDQLSYYQDAVANEAYLETARQRVSIRRHARLVDYTMHDGRNAWTYVHVSVNKARSIPQGTKILTQVVAPLSGETAPPGKVIDPIKVTAQAMERDPALTSTVVFETTHPADFDPKNNQLFIHDWGNEECCLRPGTTEAFLYSVDAANKAMRPVFKKGDFLLLEEIKGPLTGLPADANPSHRQVVVIDEEPDDKAKDPLYSDTLVDEGLKPRQAGQQELPLLRVHWRSEDAFRFPLCLSTRTRGGELLRNISVARGNIVLADHGLTTEESVSFATPLSTNKHFQLELSHGPLTMQCGAFDIKFDDGNKSWQLNTARRDLDCYVREVKPAVALQVTFSTGKDVWIPVLDLLESSPFAQQFVAEVGNDGRTVLRFGDGEYGREVSGATAIQAIYRIGNGRSGNIGAETLSHLALTGSVSWVDLVRNPLPAYGGIDPEPIEQVKQLAPAAFHAERLQAVTEADYASAAEKHPEVAHAVAQFRWTGSWHTVFIAIDPKGRTDVPPELKQQVQNWVTSSMQTGYDLEINPPIFVPLEIEIEVCVAGDHFRADVEEALLVMLSNLELPDGRQGFFHPDNFTFGQALYLSQLYAASEAVEGVDSALVTKFQRFGRVPSNELKQGAIPMGRLEIVRLDNDPSLPENGVLRLIMRGGK